MAIPAEGVLAGKGGKQDALPLPPKPAQQKKVAVKPKPEAVIDISSSETEQAKREKPNRKKAIEASSSKKKGQTLTSTLTARSKAICGLSNKPKVQIVDIDAADATNELAAVEYVEDMYKFYKEAESESHVYDYMDSQPEINQKMRAILVDWLIEVHNKFELSPETLESYSLAKSVLYRDFLLLDPCDTAAVDEYLKGQVDVRKGKHGGGKGSSQSSKSSDGRYPADGGYPVPRIVHEDDSAHCHGDSSGHQNPVPDAKIEEYLHPLLDSSLANINESEEQTEMAARVSLWKQKIKQDLEEHEARPAFDVNDHGKKVLQKLSESGDLENKVPFADVVLGEEKHDVARSFSAVLHLANNDNIDLQKSDTDDEEVMSASPFTVKFLRLLKRQPEPEVQFQSSKRRAVSQTNKGESKDMRGSSGKENCEP